MKYKFILLLVLLLCGKQDFAQSQSNNIYISVVQPQRDDISQEATEQLETKMHQLIAANGIVDSDPNGRFVITAKAEVLSKDIIGGAPQRISQKIEFTFIIGDVVENKVFESCSFTELGIGVNENKSFINAVSKIKSDAHQFTEFLSAAKNEIVHFYSTCCEQIIVEAQQQAANRDYQQAIYLLMQVPTICDCAQRCQEMMIAYYDTYSETTAKALINDAKAAWASSPNATGAAKVADIISKLPLGTGGQTEIDRLITEINQKLREDEKRDWEFRMKQYKDEIARQEREYQLREQCQTAELQYQAREQQARHQRQLRMIDACREVGLAFARNYQPPTRNIYYITTW